MKHLPFKLAIVGNIILLATLTVALTGCVSCRTQHGSNQYSYCSVIGQSGNQPVAAEGGKK